MRINDDVTIKEQTYADIFTLLGEFKLFAEETTRSFIFNLESIDQTSHDFKEMPENNDKGIETFTSEKLNVIIKCVLTQNNEIIKEPNLYNEEEENSICSFKRLGNLFKAYDYLMNGLISFNEQIENPLHFRIPLCRLIRFKGYQILILTRNPLVFSKEMLLIQGFYEQKYRLSLKFLEDFSELVETMGINLAKNSKTGGVSEKMQVFQSQIFSENAYYYLIDPIELLPKDTKFSDDFDLRLRPEMLKNNDFSKVTETLQDEFENLKEIALDSKKTSDIFHKKGLNMRYLGVLYDQSDQIYLKNHLKREMISRTCKRMINGHLQGAMKEDEKSEEIVIDFLNLLFGSGEDSEAFWSNIFSEELQIYYLTNLKVSNEEINESLFHQIISECSLKMLTDDTKIKFPMEVPNLFKISDFGRFSMKSKGYTLKGIDFHSALENDANIGKTKDLMVCFKANLSLFSMNKLMGNFHSANEFGLNLIELYLRNQNFEQAQVSLTKLLNNSEIEISALIRSTFFKLRIHLEMNEKDFLEIFAFLVKLIEINFGPFHPFHILSYLELAKFYKSCHKFSDAIFLIKNAVICAYKILDSKHWIFANLYDEMGENYLLLEKKENALFYWQKGYEIVRIKGLGFKIAELLLRMNKLLEAKEFFLKILNKKLEFFQKEDRNSEVLQKKENHLKANEEFEGSDIEILLNLSHISLILNEVSEGEKYLNQALEINDGDEFWLEYEEKLVKMAFFLASRQISKNYRKYLWIIGRSLIECQEIKSEKMESLMKLKEETKKSWNLLEFFKDYFNEISFICEKNEYINDAEYWRVYLKNLELKDTHNMKKSLKFLSYIIVVVGEKTFIEELIR